MGLEAVLAAIEAEGEAQIRQLNAVSEQRVQAILEVAVAQAQRQRQAWIARCEHDARIQAERLLRRAQHEANLTQHLAQQQAIEAALHDLRDRLSSVRTRPDYGDIMKYLMREAIEALHPSLAVDETTLLEADPRDEAIITTLVDLPEMRGAIGGLTIHYTLQCAGGLNLSSEDGRIVVCNTLEHRFEMALPELRRQLAIALHNAPWEGQEA